MKAAISSLAFAAVVAAAAVKIERTFCWVEQVAVFGSSALVLEHRRHHKSAQELKAHHYREERRGQDGRQSEASESERLGAAGGAEQIFDGPERVIADQAEGPRFERVQDEGRGSMAFEHREARRVRPRRHQQRRACDAYS